MGAARTTTGTARWSGAFAGALLSLGALSAVAKVHDCIDAKTKAPVKSDIPCPTQGPTTIEAAAKAEAERLAGIAEQGRKDAKRADQQLLNRYPDEATYRRLRSADLDPVIRQIGQATTHLFELLEERKPLDMEAEFHRGKALPAWLEKKFDANDSSLRALAQRFRDLEHDLAVVVGKYDDPHQRLVKLWHGAEPGSMGLLVPLAASPRRK
jgi:hypothetical protein